VIGNLRDVKNPLRAAEAARLLSPESRNRIEQVGRAYARQWDARARAEMDANGRYRWREMRALARLFGRLEGNPDFAAALTRAIRGRAPLFRRAREVAAWRRLLAELTPDAPGEPVHQ